jgi:hypothetical protein
MDPERMFKKNRALFIRRKESECLKRKSGTSPGNLGAINSLVKRAVVSLHQSCLNMTSLFQMPRNTHEVAFWIRYSTRGRTNDKFDKI